MTVGHHVLQVVAGHRHETPSLDLSVGTLTGFPGQHNCTCVAGDGTEELRMPVCITTTEIHEHSVGAVSHRITSRADERPTGQEYQVDDR